MTTPAKITDTPSHELIGDHRLMHELDALVAKIAPTSATVLITGESGTGKELVARAVHALSPRAQRRFVPVNCGAIPAQLLESELFGHERGAFTGAVAARPGMFQTASGGTIFLDEIGEMSPALQVKLLRVLQDGVVRPVGSEKSIQVDVRVVAATNKDLAAQVARGFFREDLYYRLQVLPIAVPPLRERRSDVALLVSHFLARRSRGHAVPLTVTDAAMAFLYDYDWPGNVRELEHLIERVAILADGTAIDVQHLPSTITAFSARKMMRERAHVSDGMNLKRTVDDFEMDLIHQALERTRGNRQAAARLLGLKRTTLVAKMRRRDVPYEPLQHERLAV